MNCKIAGVTKLGAVVFESSYPSRGWAFASATNAAIGIGAGGNPQHVHHLEIRDAVTDKELPEYANNSHLIVRRLR